MEHVQPIGNPGMAESPKAAEIKRVNKISQERDDALSVLIAEDNPSNQLLMTLLLKKVGLETEIANGSVQAVEKALAQQFDLIIMDMQMANMDGYEAVKKLRREGVTAPIVAVTADVQEKAESECIKAGCNAYLSKPISRKRLYEMIANYLSKTQ